MRETASPSRCRRPSGGAAGGTNPLAIVHEDDDLIIIDKPKGLVVHPAAGNPHRHAGQRADRPLRRQPVGIGGVRRPGIVHRLDRDTTGLMVVAKNDRATRRWRRSSPTTAHRTARARLSRVRVGRAGAAARHDRQAARPPSPGARAHGGAPRRTHRDHPFRGAGALRRNRRQAGRQHDRPPAGDRPHPPDPGAPRRDRPPADGRRHLRGGLPHQRRRCCPTRRARPSRGSDDRPCTLICWASSTR